ncbi:MAG: hypothetical protein ACOYBQ_08145 [Fluviibacter sp.]
MRRLVTIFLPIITIAVTGCQSAAHQLDALRNTNADQKLTTGVVQKEIRKGMSGGDVVSVMGSPNIVTTDAQGEVWVYDKISTETASSASTGGGTLILFGGGSSGAAKTTNQRTLTVVIKFDKNGTVRDFASHSSSF